MAQAPPPERTRVLVIGGGPVGLVASALLSARGIGNVVVERRRQPRRAPAAHVLRRRPMAVLDEIGVGAAVRRAVSPLPLAFVTWCATLGGAEIGRLALCPPDPRSGERPPPPWTNCSQSRLEPLLLRHVGARSQARLLRGVECLEVDPGEREVSARLRLEDGSERRIRADWVLAADGAGSPTRRALGIAMEGPGPLARFAMVHFAADLRPWIEKRPGPIFWILNPESPGTLIVHDPRRSHVLMLPAAAGPDARQEISRRLEAALGIPEPARILSVERWSPHVQVAARYREGRVFLVGDAAHRFPPTGGLGLNTGILEAAEWVRRLVRVGAGEGRQILLEGYEAACRPAARANAEASFMNLKRLGEISRVIGTQPCPRSSGAWRR